LIGACTKEKRFQGKGGKRLLFIDVEKKKENKKRKERGKTSQDGGKGFL